MNKQYTVKYKVGSEVVTSNAIENDLYKLEIENVDNRYSVTLLPKATFELVD